MSAAVFLHPGDTLGGFRVGEMIGRGGMAVVYRAEQVSLGRPVALKVLAGELTQDASFRERFRREGTHAAALEHPNIVPVYDSGEARGHLYIAMRLVDGVNLADFIKERGLTADQTIEILRPIASALDTAHASGLIHRDVKPQNILIASNNHPYLADFGIAKGPDSHGLTSTGGFVGSVHYASPEQINGLTLTGASDIYALTAVLYQCLTGQVPYPRESEASIMWAHVNEPPPTFPHEAGSDFHSVLARGMAKDPGARYGHAGDLINHAALCVRRMPAFMRRTVPAFPADPEITVYVPQPAPQPPDETFKGDDDWAGELLAGSEQRTAVSDPAPTRATKRGTAVLPSRRAYRRLLAVPAVAAAAVAVVALLLLTHRSHESSGPSFTSGRLALSPGKAWRAGGSSLAGLGLTSPVALRSGVTSALAGTLAHPAPEAGALPGAVFKAYGAPSHTDVMRLPLGLAKRYQWSGPRVAPLTIVVIATSRGEAAIACSADSPADAAPLTTACETLADSARITGASVEYPGADPAVQRQLASAIETRSAVLAASASGLAASSPSERGTALSQIATIDRQIAGSLPAIAGDSRYRPGVKALAAALEAEASTALRVARAASADKRGEYEAARADSAKSRAAMPSRTHLLRARGLSLPRTVPLHVLPFPAAVSRPAGEGKEGPPAGGEVPAGHESRPQPHTEPTPEPLTEEQNPEPLKKE